MTMKWYGDEAKKEVKSIVEKGLLDMAIDITKQAKANTNQPQGSSKHPQVQTGTLRRSITLDMVKEGDKIIAKVGIMTAAEEFGGGGSNEGTGAKYDPPHALEYAAKLEFGIGLPKPYPFLFPAAVKITKRAKDYF